MATTIDNLAAHHRYRVIRGFTDAKGIKVPFEAVGVIRSIDLNAPHYTEIYIDWESEGPGGATTNQRLTFLMSASDGPRNGKMKDYFERGEVVMPPGPPKATKAAPLAPEPPPRTRSDADCGDFEGKQPQDERLLHELTVACECDPIFHRPVFPRANDSVHACLRCGAVTVTRQVGDDGRFHGNAWTAYWTVPVDQKVVDWLGYFPRMAINYSGAVWRWPMSATLVRYPMLLFPADARVADAAELAALEDALARAQAPLTRASRLGSVCGVIPAIPDDLPDAFRSFAALHQALDLRSSSDLATLKAHAHLRRPAPELAADLLLRRADAYRVMMGWLSSPDEAAFSAGVAMLRDSRALFSGPDDKRLAQPLLEILSALPLGPPKDVPSRVESWEKFEGLLVGIADLGVNTPEMLDGLADLARKLASKDRDTTDAIRLVINELNGVDNRPAESR